MFELSKWARRVGEEVRNGTLRLDFTYEEFKSKVNKIPKATDFSRMAMYAMEQRKLQEVEFTIDIDSDIEEVAAPSPTRLDYVPKKETPSDTGRSKRAVLLSRGGHSMRCLVWFFLITRRGACDVWILRVHAY